MVRATDGLDAIRMVGAAAARLLRARRGWSSCEHADVQGESRSAVFAGDRPLWTDVRDQLDLAGRHRFVTAWRVAR